MKPRTDNSACNGFPATQPVKMNNENPQLPKESKLNETKFQSLKLYGHICTHDFHSSSLSLYKL